MHVQLILASPDGRIDDQGDCMRVVDSFLSGSPRKFPDAIGSVTVVQAGHGRQWKRESVYEISGAAAGFQVTNCHVIGSQTPNLRGSSARGPWTSTVFHRSPAFTAVLFGRPIQAAFDNVPKRISIGGRGRASDQRKQEKYQAARVSTHCANLSGGTAFLSPT